MVGGNAGNREGKGFAEFSITSSEGYDIVIYKDEGNFMYEEQNLKLLRQPHKKSLTLMR